MLKIDQYNCALFDCDGVILDSNKMKSEAFAQALKGEEPDLIEEFIDYHKTNGGISRYVKFAHFFENIKKSPDSKLETQMALERYAKISRLGLLHCSEIGGIRSFLTSLKSKKIRCFVISGGDEKELQSVFATRQLTQYFDKIMGSPQTKMDHMDFLVKNSLISPPIVYFGDAKSDMQTAKKHQVDFVFVSGKSEWKDGISFCEGKGIPVINNFSCFKM